MKGFLNIFCIAFTAFVCFFGISAFFYNSSFLEPIVYRALKLKINPSLVGGAVIGEFYDDLEDDAGNGNAVYPEYEAFVPGALDLICYKVHSPVYDGKWQQNPEYWQLDLDYKNGDASVRNIFIFINYGDKESVCDKWLKDDSFGVEFEKNVPWNIAVWVHDGKGGVYNSKKQIICNTENYIRKNGRQILIRIPLAKRELHQIYEAKKTYHYVVTGAYSPWELDGFIPENSSEGIYDILVPEMPLVNASAGNSQKNQLNSKKIVPVEVDMKSVGSGIGAEEVSGKNRGADGAAKAAQSDEVRYVQLVAAIKNEAAKYKEEAQQNVKPDDFAGDSFEGKLMNAKKLFSSGRVEEAYEFFGQLLKIQPDNAVVNAYYGSCMASIGGKSSPLKAMKLVNKSFGYLDKAVELADGSYDEIDVLLNRAGVAAAIPDSVFHKAGVAAKDYEKCAQLYSENLDLLNAAKGQKIQLAYFYICASENYKKIGDNMGAIINKKLAEKWYNYFGE